MFLPQIFNVYFPYTDSFGNEAQVMKWLLPSKVCPKKKSVLGIVLCIMQPYRQVSLIRKMILNVSPPVQQASTLKSIICGHHIYNHTWQPLVGEVLTLEWEEGKNHDKFTVSLLKNATVIGHVTQEFSWVFWHFLRHGETITCEVTGWRKCDKGLEIPHVFLALVQPFSFTDTVFVLRTTSHVLLNKLSSKCVYEAHAHNTWWVKPSINYVLNRKLHLTTSAYGNRTQHCMIICLTTWQSWYIWCHM